MLKKHLINLIFLSLICLSSTPVLAQESQPAAPVSFTFSDLGENDINVRTIYEQEFIDFPVADGELITRATLQLHMAHAPGLLSDLSDVVIALNDEPVGNIIFTPENSTDLIAQVVLPTYALRTGENELLLRFNLRLVKEGCSDVNSPDLWATVFADSSITFETQPIPEVDGVNQFPLPFSSFSTLPGSPQIAFVLPEKPTSAELTAAARIAASLGQSANWDIPPIIADIAPSMDSGLHTADALIVIDTNHDNSLAITAQPGVTTTVSPYDSNRVMMIVSGSSSEELLQSVSIITTRSARSQFASNYQDPISISPQPEPENPSQLSFVDAGLTTKRVRGIGLHDLYYPIDIPYDWKTTSDASIQINFLHGRAISSASLMTALVNGFEVTSVRLDARNDDDGRLVIQLSPRQIHPGRNWLHLVFDLHMPRENCKYRYFEEAWAEVSAEHSIINLAHVVSEAPLDVHYLPSHLVTPNDLSHDVIVLPAAPTQSELTAMLHFAARIGSYANADTISLNVITADAFLQTNDPVNVIAIGDLGSNAVIAQFNEQLPQPLPAPGGQIEPASGRELLPEEQDGKAAYIEIISAPWSVRSSLMVVSADSPEMLLIAIQAIPPAGKKRLNDQGTILVITPDGKTTGFSLGQFAGASLSGPIRIIFAAILSLGFVIILLVGFLINRRRQSAAKVKNEE